MLFLRKNLKNTVFLQHFETLCEKLRRKRASIFLRTKKSKKYENTIFSKNTLKICEKNTDFPVFFMILLVLEAYTGAETVFTKK